MMLKRIARMLPPRTQSGLVKIRDGLVELAGVGAPDQAATVPQLPELPVPTVLTVEGLAAIITRVDRINVGEDPDRIDSLFMRAMLSPESFRALGLEYCRRAFRDSATYRRLNAGRALGLGHKDAAFGILESLASESGELFDFMMAARCLMRPEGNESRLLDFLSSGEKRFGSEMLFYLHLATCHFVLGETAEANRILDAHRADWEPALGVGSQENIALAEELVTAIGARTAQRQTHYDDTIYDEAAIWDHWAPYYTEMNLHPPAHLFGWLRNAYAGYLRDALTSDPAITTVVDFGVMCAQPHFEVAQQLRDKRIIGVDRQRATAELNSIAFGACDNLEFVADEIESFMGKQTELGGAALFHARTATLCYPEKVRNLYRIAKDAGVRRVALFENLALSRSAGQFLDFTDFPAESVTFKNHQFIHNYRRMLEDAGFVVETEQRMFSPLVSPFWRDDICSTHVYLVATLR